MVKDSEAAIGQKPEAGRIYFSRFLEVLRSVPPETLPQYTLAEREVLNDRVCGMTGPKIANHRVISLHTVKEQIQNATDKTIFFMVLNELTGDEFRPDPNYLTIFIAVWSGQVQPVDDFFNADAGELTPPEKEVFWLIAAGLAHNKDIAISIGTTEKNAVRHAGNVLSKLGFLNRYQITALAALVSKVD